MKKQDFDSIIFDLDGTMWDSTQDAAVVWKEIASKNPQITDEITGERLKSLYGKPLEDIARGLFQSVSEEVALATMEECVIAQCPYLATHGGILLGKIEETLERLAKKYRLFIVSNCKSGYIEAFLEAHQLAEYIEDFECPGGTGLLKAENIRLVMERNGLKNPIYVGDTKGDETAAHEAGIPFLFARYGFGTSTKYEAVVDSFEEIVEKLGKLSSRTLVVMEANTLGNDVDLSMFEDFGSVTMYGESDTKENADRIAEAEIIVVNKIPMNEETLSKATKLSLICLTATGTNNIDFEYVKKRGITVTNVKGYSTQSVVQHTFALLFYVYEKLAYYDSYVKSGDYTRSDIFSNFDMKFHELFGKTWGIVGLGEIGRSVARVAEAFGCNIIYYSTSGANHNKDYESVTFNTLLNDSDIISIHAPLNEQTNNLFGEQELHKMKKAAILLNLGRGPIINQEALAKALLEGEIGGAGLDVLTVEPMSEDNPLLQVQDSTKLIITPHIAWATVEARNRCAKEVYENIKAYLKGEERNVVR